MLEYAAGAGADIYNIYPSMSACRPTSNVRRNCQEIPTVEQGNVTGSCHRVMLVDQARDIGPPRIQVITTLLPLHYHRSLEPFADLSTILQPPIVLLLSSTAQAYCTVFWCDSCKSLADTSYIRHHISRGYATQLSGTSYTFFKFVGTIHGRRLLSRSHAQSINKSFACCLAFTREYIVKTDARYHTTMREG